MREHIDTASLVVIVVTFVLFTLALFTTGFTHDLLLEVGVFLVSVKLIMMAYKNSVTSKKTLEQMHEIELLLKNGS